MLGVVKVSTPMMPKGNRGPQQPGTKLAPAGVGAVGDDAHDGIEGGGDEADDEKERAGLGGSQAEGVDVIAELQGEHRLEDEVGGHVAEAVAKLLFEGKFLDHSRAFSGVISTGHRYFVTCRVSFWRSASREELPIMISKSPGSTTYFMLTSKKESASGVMSSVTVVVSPGCSRTLRKPFSSLMGRVTELTRSRM